MPPPATPSRTLPRIALALGMAAAALIPINGLATLLNRNRGVGVTIFIVLALAQCLLGVLAGLLGLLHFSQRPKGARGAVMVLSILAVLVGLGGLVPVFLVGAIILVGGSH